MEHNRIENPNLHEHRLAIDKRGQGFGLGTKENKSRRWPERYFDQGRRTDCESSALATRPQYPLRLDKETNKVLSCQVW